MQRSRAGWGLALMVLVGCGGNFTQLSDQVGGAAGVSAGGAGSSAGTVGYGGSAGAKGGNGGSSGYGAYGGSGYGGDIYVGGYGGDIYVGGYGGDINIGGYGGDIYVGGYGGDAGSAGVAGTCGSAPAPPNPYPVKFVFNAGYTVYVRQTCSLEYQLYGCESSPVVRSAACVADCNDTSSNGCLACAGACPFSAVAVGPNASIEDTWNGESYTYGTLPSGCACASGAPAPAGTYTLSISVFSSAADAMSNTNAFPLSIQFTLPAVNNVVMVNLFQGV